MAVYDVLGNYISSVGSQRLRILAYNVGNFSDGDTTGYSGDDLDGYIAEWARFIGSCRADVAMLTESRRYIDSGNTTLSKTALYEKLFDHVEDFDQNNIPWAKVLMSDAVLSNVSKVRFTNHGNSAAGYVGALVSFNGVEIYVVSTHLIHGGDANISTRIAEMGELVDATAQYDNVIIGGDWNTADLDQLDTMRDAGFSLANGGVWGEQLTWNATTPTLPLDNVLVRGDNIKIDNFEVITGNLSDHRATIADVVVYPN